MKTKYLETNPETGLPVALIMLTDQEIIFLREVVRMYNDKRLGDIDDKNIIKIKQGLEEEFDNVLNLLRPS